jgi:hypothetical protein
MNGMLLTLLNRWMSEADRAARGETTVDYPPPPSPHWLIVVICTAVLLAAALTAAAMI